jgi:hypothetical protein
MKIGDRVRYIGCPLNCSCRKFSAEDQALLAQYLPGELHLGREVEVDLLTENMCRAKIMDGCWLIAYKEHFEVIL